MQVVDAINSYELRAEPRGDDYASLLRAALTMGCARLVFVFPRRPRRKSPAALFHQQIESWIVSDELTHDLPMHRVGRAERLREYQWKAETRDAVLSAAAGLYDWTGPALPRDLALRRANGRYWLTTDAYDRRGFVMVTASERAVLARLWPGSAGLLVPECLKPSR